MGIFGFWTERDWSQKSYYCNNTKNVICRGTPPTWGPPPPCEQALRELIGRLLAYVLALARACVLC